MNTDNILILVAIFLCIDAFILVWVFFFRKKKLSEGDRKKFQGYVRKILQESDHRRAVMEADKVLDQLLTKNGYQGTVGEKLKKASALFSDIQGVWRAHKLRNRIAHELDFECSQRDRNDAMNQFQKAYKELGL